MEVGVAACLEIAGELVALLRPLAKFPSSGGVPVGAGWSLIGGFLVPPGLLFKALSCHGLRISRIAIQQKGVVNSHKNGEMTASGSSTVTISS